MEAQIQATVSRPSSGTTPPYNEGDLNLVRGSEDLHAEATDDDADYCLVQGCEDTGANITFE